MIRTPNRGVVAAGAALGSVSIAVGVLGGSAAQASATTASDTSVAPKTVTVAPNRDSAAQERMAAEARTLTAQAAAVAAVAGATATAPPKPKHKKPKRAARAAKRAPLTPREMAKQLVAQHKGWKPAQFTCLNKLWTRESGWDAHNMNGGSGAYGIPQSLPANKMATFGSDWRDNPLTQIKWGLWYIADRYGTPCNAWAHSERYNYY